MSELHLDVKTQDGKVTILKGEAPKEPPRYREKSYQIEGGPGTVLQVLQKDPLKELESFYDNDSFLLINRDQHLVLLEVHSHESHVTDLYKSVLTRSHQLDDFGINTDRSWTTFELANFIKMNRMYFESKAKAMELVSILRNFRAKVDKDVENADDTRGNKKLLLQQKVDSNIPETFNITIPIFKGVKPQTIGVEIMIDASDFSCQLISPDAKDFIDTESDKFIDQEVNEIKKLHPELKIIEEV